MNNDLQDHLHLQIHVISVKEARKRIERVVPILLMLQEKYDEFSVLSRELERISQGDTPISEILEVKHEVDLLEDDLLDLRDQLAKIDCVLKDWKSGLVDFIGQREDKQVWLCYKLGEDTVNYYHGWEDGFRGRQKIDFD
ncbi:MAG: DUF2203 family protein [Candidatus Kariarchaeaceae archaeon]